MASGTTIAKGYVQIVPSAKGIKGSIQSILNEEAGTAGNTAGETAGNTLASKIKGIVVAAGIGTAIVKGISASLNEGGALQQSMGGIETIFKDSASKVQEYAKNAYQTAGVSANTYMEQVTSFSASLLQSLGGDTAKAANYANTAMTDMADNANKFGTDIESIQNAYQGFAKQNYTMLDNLKLGYGGTKEEMERLISDASKMTEEQEKLNLSVEDGDLSFSNIVSAISVVQSNLGITGTTAKEAATTFTGSFGMMKAAAQDFLASLTGVSDGSGNAILEVQKSLENLMTSTGTFVFNNLVPMVGNILQAFPKAIIECWMNHGDEVIQSAVNFLQNLASGLAEGLPQLLSQALPMLVQFTGKIRENAGQLISAGLDMILQLAKGIANSLPVLIQNIPQIIINICGIINDNMPKILSTGVQIIWTLIQGIIQAIPTLVANIPKIAEAIFSVITAVNWLSLGNKIIQGIANGIQALASLPVQFVNGCINQIKTAWTSGGNWYTIGKNIISGIVNGIKSNVFQIVNTMKNIASTAVDTVKSFLGIHSPSRVFDVEVGQMIPPGAANGVLKNMSPLKEAMNQLTDEALAEASIGLSTDNLARSVQSSSSSTNSAPSSNSSMSDIISLLQGILNKDNSIYMDGDEITDKIQRKITAQTQARNAFAGGY